MERKAIRPVFWGIILLMLFAVFTAAVQTVDVRCAGETCRTVGFAGLNIWFHGLTGVNWALYSATDWLGLVPVFAALGFAGLGLQQWIVRKSLRKVDGDILTLGLHYIVVLACYLLFEAYPVNYRPVLIQGAAEASYPSSTTLLVLGIMPTLAFQGELRLKRTAARKAVRLAVYLFSGFMVLGRLVSGVHWFTDIVGSLLLSAGLYCMYRGIARLCRRERTGGSQDGIR